MLSCDCGLKLELFVSQFDVAHKKRLLSISSNVKKILDMESIFLLEENLNVDSVFVTSEGVEFLVK